MNVLVLAPHPDDEILGCGGTIARHVDSGDVVTVAIMTDASKGAPELYSRESVDALRIEVRVALKTLGVHTVRFFDFPAPRLTTHPGYLIAAALSELVKDVRPEVMYVPHHGDLHTDHGVIHNAALVAGRPFPGGPVRAIYAYEALSETEWAPPQAGIVFVPNHFVDVSDQLSRKIDAMRSYESQLHSFPHPRSAEAIEALARYRGSSVGFVAAEAFAVVRTLHPL